MPATLPLRDIRVIRGTSAGSRTAVARWQNGLVRIDLPAGLSGRQQAAMLDRMLWRALGRAMSPVAEAWARELNARLGGAELAGVSFHRQQRRFGSCSARRRIYLSHRLLVAPAPLTAAVILHELAHLDCLNHGPRFWQILAAADPGCRGRRTELQAYSRVWESWWGARLRELMRTSATGIDWRALLGQESAARKRTI
ncbi:MAG: M48 family metallopeptidase [Patescibacteria group bacterium]